MCLTNWYVRLLHESLYINEADNAAFRGHLSFEEQVTHVLRSKLVSCNDWCASNNYIMKIRFAVKHMPFLRVCKKFHRTRWGLGDILPFQVYSWCISCVFKGSYWYYYILYQPGSDCKNMCWQRRYAQFPWISVCRITEDHDHGIECAVNKRTGSAIKLVRTCLPGDRDFDSYNQGPHKWISIWSFRRRLLTSLLVL